MAYTDRYLGLMGRGPKRIPHWESLYCPEALSEITGIDYYERPRSCMLRLNEMYPRLGAGAPGADTPLPRPQATDDSPVVTDENGNHHVRWGADLTWHFDWGKQFASVEDVLSYSPLEHLDLADAPITEPRDYSDEEALYREYRRRYPAEWGATARLTGQPPWPASTTR